MGEFFFAIEQQLVIDDLLIDTGRLAVLLEDLLRVGDFQEDLAATDLRLGVLVLDALGALHRLAKGIDGVVQRLRVGLRIGRIGGGAHLRLAEPE